MYGAEYCIASRVSHEKQGTFCFDPAKFKIAFHTLVLLCICHSFQLMFVLNHELYYIAFPVASGT